MTIPTYIFKSSQLIKQTQSDPFLQKSPRRIQRVDPLLQSGLLLNTPAAKNTNGFTLVELLTVLAILAILLVLAIPSGQHLFTQNQTTAQINTLLGGMNYARFEAISRNEKLKFCKSADHESCGGHWRDGQILLDSKKNVLRVFPALSKKNDLVWDSSGGLDDFIVWLPTGYTNSQRGTFYYCAGNNNVTDSRSIVLLDTGRSYVTSMSAKNYATYCFK